MNVELRHARVVAAISATQSISKAAVELKIPQPSLTAQLRRIEKAMGGELFVRSRSGVVPTILGERLIPMMLDLVERADALIAEASATGQDTLYFGNAEWTPPTLRGALQAALPGTQVWTETVGPDAAVAALRRGTLTAALVPGAGVGAGLPDAGADPVLSRLVVVREPVWVALPKGHPMAARPVLGTTELASLTWVRFTRDHWFHRVESALFESFGSGPELLHRVASHAEAMSWVSDGGAAALATPTGATSDVRLVPIAGTRWTEMQLMWRSGLLGRATVDRLAGTVRQYYCEYARSIPRYWAWIAEHPSEFTELSGYLAGPVSGRSAVDQSPVSSLDQHGRHDPEHRR
ncbi:LysR family transcriptional regulator [Kitasatospora sp. NPDC097605]|uniref:LysR family transcriptional regulator n=1 Tax=Kitasatospora sp. NPDC097605 TaxID=3157226 RepID=UPI0033210181